MEAWEYAQKRSLPIPKQWHFWMYDQGWGKVLNYIGIEWETYQTRF